MVQPRVKPSRKGGKTKRFWCLFGVATIVVCVVVLKSERVDPEKSAAVAIGSSSNDQPPAGQKVGVTSLLREKNKPDDRRVCSQNPYSKALGASLDEISVKMDRWLNSMPTHLERADLPETKTDHERFFVFEEMATCSQSCIGGACRDDVSKIVCGAEELKEGCVVYSIGGNDQWEFELDILAKTPCEVHTFDCTGEATRFHKPDNDRLTFHHICLGSVSAPKPTGTCHPHGVCGETMTLLDIQKMLHHSRIDLLKMDIEGYEWTVFESWKELSDASFSASVLLPMQILVEVHYATHLVRLLPKETGQWTPRHLVDLQAHLLRMGYVTIVRDDNIHCNACTELTLIRALCPITGVYAHSNF